MNRVNGLNSIAESEPQAAKPLTMAEIAEGTPIQSEDELEPEEVILDVECIDCNNKHHVGAFILRCVKNNDINQIEKIKVGLGGGKPLSLFPVSAMLWMNAIATCSWMFRKGSGSNGTDPAPAWWYAATVDDLPLDLFLELADAVQDHSERYFRRNPETGKVEKGRGMVKIVRQGIKGT